MGRIGFGVLGAGRIARTVGGAIHATPGAALAAVASRDLARAKAYAATYCADHAYGDYEEMLACPAVDVVYVATPPARHAADVRAALAAGKHVLCEKPFTLSAADAADLSADAQVRGLFLMEALWSRFLPAVERTLQLIEEGAIGRPQVLVAGGAFVPDAPADYFLFRPELGGGVMRDAGVYLLHFARWIMGPIARVLPSAQTGATGVDDQDAVILEHAEGGRSLLYVSMRARRAPDLYVLGEAGRLELGAPLFNPARLDLVGANGAAQSWAFASDLAGYGGQIAEVVRCVREGRLQSAKLPHRITLEVMQALEAVTPSAADARAA